MNSKRTIVWLACFLLAIGVGWYYTQVFGEQDAGPKPNLVVVTGGSGPYWQLIANGASKAAGEYKVNLDVLMPKEDENQDLQIQLISGIDTGKVDGVALSPLDAEGEASIINRLAEKAFVVTMDSDASQTARLLYVGTSNIVAGRTCAQLVQEAVPEGGKVAVFMANLTKENMVERKQGFEETLNGPNKSSYDVVDYFVDNGSNDKCKELVKQVLEENSDLTCLVGMNARHGPILLEVLKETEKLEQVQLVTFDDHEATLEGVEAGHIFATITQDPYQYGYQAVRALAHYSRSSEAQRPLHGSRSTLSINTQVLRQEDVAKFREELKLRMASK